MIFPFLVAFIPTDQELDSIQNEFKEKLPIRHKSSESLDSLLKDDMECSKSSNSTDTNENEPLIEYAAHYYDREQ